ncbi:MAG: thiamine biosynthesis protein ThiS [Verrucomicrobiales bacterium]|nr:thiamine biosynthesis protein ThiS [Verrucomicrobiales bacterium]
MPRVVLTQNLRRHVDVSECTAEGTSVAECLENVFSRHPKLRSYLLEDTGAVRQHIAIILDGEPIRDRTAMSDPVTHASEIFVLQALSGG